MMINIIFQYCYLGFKISIRIKQVILTLWQIFFIDNKSEILDMVQDYKTTDNSFFVADTQSDDSPKVGWNSFFLCLATKSDYLFSFIYRDAVSLFFSQILHLRKVVKCIARNTLTNAMQRMSSVVWKICRKIFFFSNFPDKTTSNSYLPISDLHLPVPMNIDI